MKLESQGDDELLIGKLQRQLMSTKMSFKAFVKKFQCLSGNMRQRELAMRHVHIYKSCMRDSSVYHICVGAVRNALVCCVVLCCVVLCCVVM